MQRSDGREPPADVRRWALVGGATAALVGVVVAFVVRKADAEGRMLVALVAAPVAIWIVAVGPLFYVIRTEQRSTQPSVVDEAVAGARRTTYRLTWLYLLACVAIPSVVALASRSEAGAQACGPGPSFPDHELCVTTERLVFGPGATVAVLVLLLVAAGAGALAAVRWRSTVFVAEPSGHAGTHASTFDIRARMLLVMAGLGPLAAGGMLRPTSRSEFAAVETECVPTSLLEGGGQVTFCRGGVAEVERIERTGIPLGTVLMVTGAVFMVGGAVWWIRAAHLRHRARWVGTDWWSEPPVG